MVSQICEAADETQNTSISASRCIEKVYLIEDNNVVNVLTVDLDVAALLEHFTTYYTLELRINAALELQMSIQSFLILVRPTTSIRAHESVCNHNTVRTILVML